MVEANKTDKVSKRVNLACHYCRRRKKKCDGHRPTCSNCAAVGEQCVYQLKSPQSKTNVRFDKLKSQMDRMEQMIARIAESQNPEYRVMPSDSDSSAYSVGSTGGEEVDLDTADQKDSIDDPVEDETIGDLPDFNDRLEQLMSNQTAGNLDSLVYTSGIFLSIFSPSEVERLARKMHNPNTILWLSKTSNLIWKLQQRSMMVLVEASDQEIDSEFAQFCLGLHRQVLDDAYGMFGPDLGGKFVPASLISSDDISPERLPNWPVHLRRGVIAAVVLESTVILKMSASSKRTRWSDQYISQQQRIALHHCIDLLNIMKFSRPSYVLAKTSMNIMCNVSKFFCVPAILSYLDSLVELARSLALNNEAVNSKLPEAKARERVYLWNLIMRGYTQLMISRLSNPKTVNVPFIRSWGSELGSSDDVLKNIYLPCRKKLFGLYKNRYVSRSDIQKEIQRSGAALDEWWNNWGGKKKCTDILTYNSKPTTKNKKRRTSTATNTSEHSSSAENTADGSETKLDLAIYEHIDFMHKAVDIQRYREYLFTKLVIYSIPAFYPHYLPEPSSDALDIVRQTARDLMILAVTETKNAGVCYYAMTLCATAAIGALLFKQLKHIDHPTNKDDIEFLKANLPSLNVESWPSVADDQNPMMELWSALLHIMEKVHECKDLPPADMKDPTLLPYGAHSNATNGGPHSFSSQHPPGGSFSGASFPNYASSQHSQLQPSKQQQQDHHQLHQQQHQQQHQKHQQHHQNILHPGVGQVQGVSSGNYYTHPPHGSENYMRRGGGYANTPLYIKTDDEYSSMRGASGVNSPASGGSTASIASNGSYMSNPSMPSPPVSMPMSTYSSSGHSAPSGTIDTRAMLPHHVNRPLSEGTPLHSPLSVGYQNHGNGRDGYSNDPQNFYGSQYSSRSPSASFAPDMPTVEENPVQEMQPGHEVYDFETMVDNNPDLILRDVEQPENCSIA